MNLTKKRKKKGFTLIELMAVIAIIAILAAVLVPTVSGYINRAKKTAIITQVRNVVNAVETYNATITDSTKLLEVATSGTKKAPQLSEIKTEVGSDLLSDTSKLPDDLTLSVMKEINTDTNSIKYMEIDQSGKLIKYSGKVKYPIAASGGNQG